MTKICWQALIVLCSMTGRPPAVILFRAIRNLSNLDAADQDASLLLNLLAMSFVPADFEGRKGWQWVESAKAYADYRAGKSWRASRDRNHPDVVYYAGGAALLNVAVNSSSEVCPCVYCCGAPFADAEPRKKPVASVAAPSAVAASRKAGA